MLLRTVGRESRRSSHLSRDRPALSFSGEIAQIRRTPEGTGVNPLERSCGRQNHESGNGAAGVAFPCSTCRNILPGALERDSPEAPLNGVEVETTAGNSGKLQFLIRIALGILLLRYAGRQPASTSPWHCAQKRQRFIRRNCASLCQPRLCRRKSDRRK